MNTKVERKWMRKPNWFLHYNGRIVACWYADNKTQAKTFANAYVKEAKRRNNLKPMKLRVYKKDFVLKQTAKGADDA